MTEADVKKFLEQKIEQVKQTALNILEVEAPKIIKKNFREGGRPVKWKASKKPKKLKGTKTLVVSGNLSNVSAVKNEAQSSITLVTSPLARAYARIHQEGGTINMPARKLKFRQKKYKDGSVRSVFASSRHKKISAVKTTKPYKIVMPPRPYMVIPQDELNRVMTLINKRLNFLSK